MPKILEQEALFLAQNIDGLEGEKKASALDILTRYKQQQEDEGLPHFPTQESERRNREIEFREMFKSPEAIKYEPAQFSANPILDKQQHANMALLVRAYQKEPLEIAERYDFFLNDYASQRFSKKEIDTAGFYAEARKMIERDEKRENAFLEGSRAALRGENVISSLQGWQAKNLDMMEDSSQFTQGFLRAQEKAGDMIPLADKMLKLMESGTGKSNSTRVFDADAAKELDDMTAELATMKPRERKEVYASIAARVEAAGYDQKGFWSQMLGQIDQGLFRMSQTVPQGMGSVLGTIGEFVGGSDVSEDQQALDRRLKERGQETMAEMKLRQEKLGEVQSEVAQIISGTVDPVKGVVGWIPDYIEEGLIKGPGAVLPFMTASAALGPYGAGLVFTADFAEQNRRDLVVAGLDRDDAARIGMMAAPLQAAVESLSNAFQLGKWASPIGPGSSFLKRYVTNSIASGATEFTEEQVQENIIRPIVRDVVGMIDANVPQIGFGEMWDKMKSDTPELISVLAPMALVFGGVMTNADLQLSRDLTSNVDGMTALGYSQAQATTVIREKDEAGRIAKARELWGVRAGTKESMQSGAAKLSEKLRLFQADASLAQAELERRGKIPRMLPTQEGSYRLTMNDGSTAEFPTYQEASAARWAWFRDQLGKESVLLRQSLEGLEKNLERGRELAIEFKPETMTASEAKERGIISETQLKERMEQAAVLDESVMMGDAVTLGKIEGNQEEVAILLGMSKNQWFDRQGRELAIGNFKNDVLRTTVKLWEGAGLFTLVEEKTEGDAKALISSGKRDWMLERLRSYEKASGDKLFRFEDDEKLNSKDLIEAWSHVAQAYLITGKEGAKGRSYRRYLRNVEESGLTAALNAQATEWQSVVNRAQKLMEAKKAGTLPADFTEELERQLGIDSQVKHDAGALQELASIIDTSGYSEETPGPNGETFSMSRATPADSSKVVQMPDGARLVGPTTFSIRAFHGTPHKVDKFTTAKIGTGEGAQAYGWGLYFAEVQKVAENYRFDEKAISIRGESIESFISNRPPSLSKLAKDRGVSIEEARAEWDAMLPELRVANAIQSYQSPQSVETMLAGYPDALERFRTMQRNGEIQWGGNLYTVELLPDADQFLDWDKPLSEQSEKVREVLPRIGILARGKVYSWKDNLPMGEAYRQIAGDFESDQKASEELAKAGIPGIRYLDGGSRGAGDGTRNYVIFDESLVKILEENGKPVESFSLRSGDFEARAAAMFSPFQRTPELRMAIARVAKERAMRLGAEWIEKAAVLRTSASISKEQAFREADSFDRRMNDYLDSLTPSARQTLEFEPSTLENDPLVAAMLDEGKLMSRSTAIKNGVQNLDEYDGAPWLPPAWYSKGAGITPGKMAKALHDGPLDQGGPLSGDSAQDLWEELGQIIASTRKNKAVHREAVQAYQDAKKQAKADVKAEAEAWATQAKKEAGSPKAQREMLKAALRTLDGILSAAPPEVRARVGGYVKLAGLATDEAMLQEIERRVAKLNVELEKWLKKEAVAEIRKVLKKGRPDSDSGKKAKGKDADMHALFAAAEAAMGMDALQVAGKLADLDARIGSGELSNDQEILAITERGLVELVGDLDNADSGRAWSALETLQDIYRGGWLKWKLKQIERRENRAGLRHALIADTGKKGIKLERDEADKVAMTMFGKGMGGLLSISSFHEVLSNAFGSKSERVTSLVDAEREASGQYEDASQNLADEVEELFSSLAGGSVLKGERLRYDMAQRTIETPKGNLSQLEAIQALLMWKQEDGQRHMAGTRNEAGEITSSWSYDQAWIDQIDAALTPEARRVMAWIVGKYGAEWQTLNPLYRERYGVNLPHHDNYAPLTVVPVQAKPGEVVDPVSGAAMSSGSILTPGSLRTRSRSAIAEPEFRDALQTLLVHSRQMEYWKAYFDLATEASAALGNRDVINSVRAKGGEESATALRKWVDALAQGGFRDASASLGMFKILSRMTGRAASVGLLGRFSTLLVQSTQLAAASVKMPVTSYLRGMSKLLTGRLGYGDAIRSEFIQRRFRSAPPIVRQALEGLGTASKPNEITRATRALGQLLSGTDALFTAGTYALLLDYHRGTGRALGLTGAELEEHAHTEAERATEQVAQPTRMATRSLAELTSTNPIAKVSWAYASEARQKIALMAWASYKAKSEPAQFAKTAFLVFGVGGLMTQIIKNLWREAKGDDDESKWDPARLTLRAMAAPLHGVPLASELLGDQGMLSGVQWAWPAVKDIASGEGDMRDVDTLLSVLGLFNDTAAGISSLSHAGLDAAKVVENLAE